MSDIRLVVQSDDFGMEHAINEGVERAFSEGILTQASIMVACPWFLDAVRRAKEFSIPVGVHLTLTSEWDYYRWKPITRGGSLVRDDGTFSSTVPGARKRADLDEATNEFAAQVELLLSQGIEPCYFDCHMGVVHPPAYVEMCKRYDKPFIYPLGEVGFPFDSNWELSKVEDAIKEEALIDHISALGSGTHIVVTHVAVDSPALWRMRRRDHEDFEWAAVYRLSDLAAVKSPRVREVVESRGIELCSIADLTGR